MLHAHDYLKCMKIHPRGEPVSLEQPHTERSRCIKHGKTSWYVHPEEYYSKTSSITLLVRLINMEEPQNRAKGMKPNTNRASQIILFIKRQTNLQRPEQSPVSLVLGAEAGLDDTGHQQAGDHQALGIIRR